MHLGRGCPVRPLAHTLPPRPTAGHGSSADRTATLPPSRSSSLLADITANSPGRLAYDPGGHNNNTQLPNAHSTSQRVRAQLSPPMPDTIVTPPPRLSSPKKTPYAAACRVIMALSLLVVLPPLSSFYQSLLGLAASHKFSTHPLDCV